MQGKYVVADIMVRNVIVAAPSETVYDAARKMNVKGVGSLVIVDGTRVLGILTEQDIVRKVVANDHNPVSTPISTVMTSRVDTVSPRDDLQEAITLMGRDNVRHMPVVQAGELVGIISAKDIIAVEPILIEMLQLNS